MGIIKLPCYTKMETGLFLTESSTIFCLHMHTSYFFKKMYLPIKEYLLINSIFTTELIYLQTPKETSKSLFSEIL